MNSVVSRPSKINKNFREMDTREVRVDSEINFRVHTEQPDKYNRFSSSSDEPEQVDMSDEMLELDNMDINYRFIADCAREAATAAAISSPNEEKDQAQVNKARQKAEDMIRKAETKWAQLLATPGKYPQVVNNEVQLQNPWGTYTHATFFYG